MKKLLILILGIFLISFTFAWTITTFTNNLTSENLEFTKNENITRSLSLYKDSYILNANMDLSALKYNPILFLDEKPIMNYQLDETSGAVIDAMNNYNGTNHGATRGIQGIMKNAFSFNGMNEYVNIPYDIYMEDEFTFNFWYKTIDNSTWSVILGQTQTTAGWRSSFVLQNASGKIGYRYGTGHFGSGNVDVLTTTSIPNNEWHMITIHVDRDGEAHIYYDGELETTHTMGTNFKRTGFEFFRNTESHYYEGKLDEVGVWDRELNATEVSYLYDSYTDVKCYQESANTTNQSGTDGDCGLNYSGNVVLDGNGVNMDNLIDGDWTTFSYVSSGSPDAYTYINYSKPYKANNKSVWQIRPATLELFNIIIDNECFNQDVLQFQIIQEAPSMNLGYSQWFCNNGSDWVLLHNESGNNLAYSRVSEEAMNWSVEGYIKNPYVMINNTKIWEHSGEFNSTHSPNKTSNFASTLNTALNNGACDCNGCILDGSNCVINFTFHSDWIGCLEYSAIDISNDGFLENSQTYNNETIEGSTETFKINITYDDYEFPNSQGYLIYNGNSYLATRTGSNKNYTFTRTINIPIVEAEINKTFYWSIVLNNGTNNYYNSTFNNQTIKVLAVDDCSVYTTHLYNISIFDEENKSILSNTILELQLEILSLDRTDLILNFSKEYTGINPLQVCLNINLSENNNYSLDTIIKYQAQDYEIEYYNIIDSTLSNNTIPENIYLYDLLSVDSTEFQITFKDSDFIAMENALIFVQRQYISENNLFRNVELPKTDSNGQALVHLVEKDIIYNILVMNSTNGNVLATFNNIVAFCEDATIGDCKLNLNAYVSGGEVFNYDTEIKIGYTTPVYDEATGIISFDFYTLDGTLKNVQMITYKFDMLGNTTACNNSLESSSGTLSCVIPSHLGNSTILINIYVDGNLVLTDYLNLDDSDFGDEGYFLMFLLVLSLILMFNESKTAMLVGLLIGFITSSVLSLIQGKIIGIGASILWLIILIMIMIWKLNKDKQN